MYRLISMLTEPYVSAQLALGLTLAYLWRQRVLSRRMLIWLTTLWTVLYLLFLPPVAYLLCGSLEWGYPPKSAWPADTQAIVVLSAGHRPANNVRREAEPTPATMFRCLHAADIYRKLGPRPIIVSGGNVDPRKQRSADAQLMRQLLIQLGVAEEDVILEDQSKTTFENAIESAKIINSREWTHVVLVTDATHLHRSVLCFAKQGVSVVPSGCFHRATDLPASIHWLLPEITAMGDSHVALHEWTGLAWYYLRGRI